MTRISSARITMEGGRVDQSVLKSYDEYMGATGGNAGIAPNVSIINGNVYSYVLDQPLVTFTFSNPAPVGTLTSFTLILRQDSTGGRSVSWPTSVVWPGFSGAPTLSAGANRFDVFTFMTTSSGNGWMGFVAGKNYS